MGATYAMLQVLEDSRRPILEDNPRAFYTGGFQDDKAGELPDDSTFLQGDGFLCFILNCVPTAQARPRHARTKNGMAMTYKSAAQKANEETLHALLGRYIPVSPFTGAIRLRFTAILPAPSGASRTRREAMLAGKIRPVKKPDLDNLAKQLKDAMTRMRFWEDDRQVVELSCKKIYGQEPCWHVTVEEICGVEE